MSDPTSTDSSSKPEDAITQRQREETLLREKLAKETQHREEVLHESTKELFEKLAVYLNGELLSVIDDFKLLETMNKVTTERYAEMTNTAAGLVNYMKELQEKYAKFQPYLAKIDEIDASLTELEKTVSLLDDYTIKLENKFRYLKEAKRLPLNKNKPLQGI